jgi:hypothetical protein
VLVLSNKRPGARLEALLPGAAGEKDGKLREINIDDIVPNPGSQGRR